MVLEYTTNVEAAASLELFDIHLMDSFEKVIKKQIDAGNSDEDRDVEVSKASYFYVYFVEHIFSILKVPNEEIFTKSLEFNQPFVHQLANENLNINTKFERYKSEYIRGLGSKAKFIAGSFQFIKWVDFH